MIKINLINIAVYDDNYKYIDEQLHDIPLNTVTNLKEIINIHVKNLIAFGKFNENETESYCYGGVGCGDNSCMVYENSSDCQFEIVYYYDGSNYDIHININENFKNNSEFMNVINNIKKINMLDENVFKNIAKTYTSQNKVLKNYDNCNNSDENDD